mmetsp:Transcript_20069/g.47191  ORF Transcript_20069/g.47191 Transcript_20069/m.47191 type:complete len:204 (-) Transcript_20069:1703-2314(-)
MRISAKSSMLTDGDSEPLKPLSESSAIDPRKNLLTAPRPALSMNEERPQFVTAIGASTDSCMPEPCVTLRKFCSASRDTDINGTFCDFSGLGSSSSGTTCSSGSTPFVGTAPLDGLLPAKLDNSSASWANVVLAVSDVAVPRGACLLVASASRSMSAMAHSALSWSKLNLSDGAHSAAASPCLFSFLTSTPGCRNSSRSTSTL